MCCETAQRAPSASYAAHLRRRVASRGLGQRRRITVRFSERTRHRATSARRTAWQRPFVSGRAGCAQRGTYRDTRIMIEVANRMPASLGWQCHAPTVLAGVFVRTATIRLSKVDHGATGGGRSTRLSGSNPGCRPYTGGNLRKSGMEIDLGTRIASLPLSLATARMEPSE